MIKNKNFIKMCLITVTCFVIKDMVAQNTKLFENNFDTERSPKLIQPENKLLNLEHDKKSLYRIDEEVYSKKVYFKGELIVISFDKSKSLEDQLNKLENDNDDAEKRDFILNEFLTFSISVFLSELILKGR